MLLNKNIKKEKKEQASTTRFKVVNKGKNNKMIIVITSMDNNINDNDYDNDNDNFKDNGNNAFLLPQHFL